VTNSAELLTALNATTPTDIVLADGMYDNPTAFANPNGHRLYAAHLLSVTLTAGVNVASNWAQPGSMVRGIAFDVADPAKTVRGSIIFSAGTSQNTQVLDSTFNGHSVLAAAVWAYQADGLVVKRVQIQNFTDWGVLGDSNDPTTVLTVPMVFEDITVANVSRAVPRSAGGTAESCLGVGDTATVRRVRARNCAWMGVTSMNASGGSLFEDLDIDGAMHGLYIEHLTWNTTFQRMRIGPSVTFGVVCEGTDPNAADWGGRSASVDNVIQDSTIDSAEVGVLMGWTTTRTTARRILFRDQYVAAVTDYKGVDNSYYDNDYSGIQAGALPVSPVWWRQ